VEHGPSGLICTDLQHPLQALRGDAVLLRGEHPAGVEPHRQRRAGAVEDGAGGHRSPCAALGAHEPAIAQPPPDVGAVAGRADEAVGPAQPGQVVQAVDIGAEPGQEVPGGAGVVHTLLRVEQHAENLLRLNRHPNHLFHNRFRPQPPTPVRHMTEAVAGVPHGLVCGRTGEEHERPFPFYVPAI
jgi:hypothetical protein